MSDTELEFDETIDEVTMNQMQSIAGTFDKLMQDLQTHTHDIEQRTTQVEAREQALETANKQAASMQRFNVGGEIFTCAMSTLQENASPGALVLDLSGHAAAQHSVSGAPEAPVPFFDRDPKLFRQVLNFYRNECALVSAQAMTVQHLLEVKHEARKCREPKLEQACEAEIARRETPVYGDIRKRKESLYS